MSAKVIVATVFCVIFAFMFGAAWANDRAEKAHSSYVNVDYDFSMSPIELGAAERTSHLVSSFTHPPTNGFAANITVIIQETPTSLEAYKKTSLKGFEAMAAKVNTAKDMKVNGRDAWLVDYEARISGVDARCLTLAVIDDKRVLLITGTALQKDYAASEAEFKRCIASFKLH